MWEFISIAISHSEITFQKKINKAYNVLGIFLQILFGVRSK